MNESKIVPLTTLRVEALIGLIDEVKQKLPERDLSDIYVFVSANRWKAAFEALCTAFLFAKNITISQPYYTQLLEYAKLMGLPESAIASVSNLIDPIFINGLEIKIGCDGQILNGKYQNWFMHIKDDDGAYYIYIFENIDHTGEGYDYWLEDKAFLIRMLKKFNWEIKWLT